MQRNKATIIVYLLIVLVAVFPAVIAMGERQAHARAPGQPPESEPRIPSSSPTSPKDAQVEVKITPTKTAALRPSATAADVVEPTTRPVEYTPVPPTATAETLVEVQAAAPTATRKPGELAPPLEPYAGPPSDQWKEWPVIPTHLSSELRAVYRRGIEQGNNPHAFSVLGDCQSVPDVFMGIYDHDPDFVEGLPSQLQETVRFFGGSFERYSPTVKDGSTEGALLWWQWNDNLGGYCQHGESPIDCELRYHKPSIVFIHVGTHWEARNRNYLKIIIGKILDHGAIPVLVTKADNRELDWRVNQNYADLAAEYNLPLWNFWASVQHLPENGMEPGSDMYLSQAGLEIHRQGALQALDALWRMAYGPAQ